MKKEYLVPALLMTLICVLLLIVPLFMFPMALQEDAHIYEIAAVVDEVNEEACTLVDAHGEAWVWEGRGLEVGQPVIIEFNDMGTDDIYDDEIISIIFEKRA